jgi:hypothetical protein
MPYSVDGPRTTRDFLALGRFLLLTASQPPTCSLVMRLGQRFESARRFSFFSRFAGKTSEAKEALRQGRA